MKHSQDFWRGLFFILLIVTLCGGLAAPVPARAAPETANALDVVINEVAWSGTTASSSDEWIELYNPTSSAIPLTNWRLTDGNDINKTLSGSIAAGGYFLLERTNDSTISDIAADLTYSGGLTDGGESLSLFDDLGNLIDSANLDGGSWPPGLAPPNRNSMERINSLAPDSDSNWALNNGLVRNGSDGGTPAAPINGTPKQPNSVTLALTATVTPMNTSTATSTGTPTPTGTATDTPTATPTFTPTATLPTGSATSIVISEFRTRGPNGSDDEFIELYNPTSAAVDISGWKINASNDTGGTGTRATIPASILLRTGQYYLIVNNSSGGYSGNVTADLTYGTSIMDTGGIAIVKPDNTVVDQVGMSSGSAYKEDPFLSPPLSGTSNQSYERKNGGCQDTDNNNADFVNISTSNPHNYASPFSLCGTPIPNAALTTTTITADTPDSSVTNEYVSVSVTVTGGSSTSGGKVNITGANINCTITLGTSGTGTCSVLFTTTGSKTLTATYIGDNTHLGSSDTEPHQVSTTSSAGRTPTPTPRATPIPPQPLLVINEFVPRPGHDWNNDGVINVGDEYIEVLNHGVIDVVLSNYSLDDEVNIGSTPFTLPSVTLKPGERYVLFGSVTGLLLSDGGDGVRLLSGVGQLVDAYNYLVVRFPDQSFCRLPDNGGADDWSENCFPTPGLQNSQSASSVNSPTSSGAENLCPIADTLPSDFVLAECPGFGNNIWNQAYWDKFGWFDEKYLSESWGKWSVFVD